MYKKLLAALLVCTLLVSISPAVAAKPVSAQPTVEEILNEYHQRSFEKTQSNGTSANARSGNNKTLEDETIDALNEAGYEAYNVTAENYHTLESTLMCDFADLGLDPNGSYMIVISGEDENNNVANPNSRAFDGPTQDLFDPGGGGSFFTYTYQNKTYNMRYVTVTGTDMYQLRRASKDIELFAETSNNDFFDTLNLYLTVLSFSPYFSAGATVLSLLISAMPDIEGTLPDSLTYKATSIWNITYTQVYDFQSQTWKACSGVEYVIPQYFLNYYYCDPSTGIYTHAFADGQLPNIYSEYYYDTEYIKEQAARAFEYNACAMDVVEDVVYKFNGSTVDTHYRRWEYIDFFPPT